MDMAVDDRQILEFNLHELHRISTVHVTVYILTREIMGGGGRAIEKRIYPESALSTYRECA
jgi:hypothetical protein